VTTVGTVPPGKEWAQAVIRFCNTDTVDHTVTIYNFDPGSEAADDQRAEFKELVIQAKSTFEYSPAVLPPNRRIAAIADVANKVNARIHGWEVTP
jgi:hypothetical protein